MKSRTFLFSLLGLIWLGLAAEPALPAATNVVRIDNYNFTPTNLVMSLGDTVLWTNVATVPHDTTSRSNGLWSSPLLSSTPPNSTFRFTFTNIGYYPYFCFAHRTRIPQDQTGTISVVSFALTNPINGSVFAAPASLNIQASASTNVTQAQFFQATAQSTNSLGTDITAPFSGASQSLPAGRYSFFARITDTQGRSMTSSIVNVTLTPTIHSLQKTAGQFAFTIRGGAANQTCVIEAGADPSTLTPLRTNTFSNTVCPSCPAINFVDTNPPATRRFYRARLP